MSRIAAQNAVNHIIFSWLGLKGCVSNCAFPGMVLVGSGVEDANGGVLSLVVSATPSNLEPVAWGNGRVMD